MRRGVPWKGYAQDLGGAQPVGSSTYVTGSKPGVSDTVPGRDDGICGYPWNLEQRSGHEPDEPRVAPTGDVTSFTGRPAGRRG